MVKFVVDRSKDVQTFEIIVTDRRYWIIAFLHADNLAYMCTCGGVDKPSIKECRHIKLVKFYS